MRTRFREFEPYDLQAVLDLNYREIDIIEAVGATGLPFEEALMASLNVSTDGLWVITIDNRIVGVFGVAPIGRHTGSPWLLSTPELFTDPEARRTFLSESKRVFKFFAKNYDCLTNFVSIDNRKAIRWLRWLGFRFEPQPVILTRGDVLFYQFYYFTKENDQCVAPLSPQE